MQGTVIRMRHKGVEALMDGPTDSLTQDNHFQVYHIVDGVETVLGTFYAKRSKGPNLICLNLLGDGPGAPGFVPSAPRPMGILQTIQVGDLVRSI